MKPKITKSYLEILLDMDLRLIEQKQVEIQDQMKNLQAKYDKLSAMQEKYLELRMLLAPYPSSVSEKGR